LNPRPLLLAVQFLTRFPVPATAQVDDADLGRSPLFYPLVGLLIGACLWLLAAILDAGTGLLPAALILSLWVGLTGALHLDGLADTADAWIGGQGDRDRTLAIMKDSCSGPLAVVAVVLLLLIKFSALTALPADGGAAGLLLAPVAGRTVALALLTGTPYVRAGGLGSVLAQRLPREPALVVVAVVCLGLAWVDLPALLAVVAAVWLLRLWMMRRLGGATGDTIGAGVEIGELAWLVALVL
jgi:adenosylcobinamide-GDP ribazoletransferase